jgi:nitrite reductase/ring-hydroxylating ferredoxin subunit
MEKFVNVAKVDEIRRRTGKLVFTEGLFVALLNSDGAFYGLENRCPLDGASLSDGVLVGSLVECPGDKARFFLPTGECISQPEAKRLRSYRIRVDKEDIYVDLRHRSARNKSEHEIAAGLQPGAVLVDLAVDNTWTM